mgnify:FL=1
MKPKYLVFNSFYFRFTINLHIILIKIVDTFISHLLQLLHSIEILTEIRFVNLFFFKIPESGILSVLESLLKPNQTISRELKQTFLTQNRLSFPAP